MVLSDNLVAYYPLNEASGDAIDAVAGLNLADQNTVGSGTGIVEATARDFELSNSEYFSVADNATLSMGNIDFTICAWLKFESKGANAVMIIKGTSSEGEYVLEYLTSIDRIRLTLVPGGGWSGLDSAVADTLGSPSTGVWYFVVGWYNAATDVISISVNDGAVDTKAGYAGGAADKAADFAIGGYASGSYFDGLMQGVGLWKRILTSAEITELYNSGSGRTYAYISGGGGGTGYKDTASRFKLQSSGATDLSPPTEWNQDAGNAYRWGASSITPSTPWRYMWSWNGSDEAGDDGNHIYDAPPHARPVFGADVMFCPAGADGVYGVDIETGLELWNYHYTGDAFVASGVYDSATDCFAAVTTDGWLMKFPSATGGYSSGNTDWRNVKALKLAAGSRYPLMLHPSGRYVYAALDDGSLVKCDLNTSAGGALSLVGRYLHASQALGTVSETAPAYSLAGGSTAQPKIVYATSDGYVHAIRDSEFASGATVTAGGTGGWRVAPHNATWGGEVRWTYWPVVAENHSIVLIRCQLATAAMTAGPSTVDAQANRFPDTAAGAAADTIQTWFGTRASPGTGAAYRNLFALSMTDGAESFVPAVGYGCTEGYRNGGNVGVMPPPPAIAIKSSAEVAYIQFRNGDNGSPDFRWDGNAGEMLLADDDPVSGLDAGDVRFIRMGQQYAGGAGYVHIIDEQCPITVLGNILAHAHWDGAEGVVITDRASARGLTFADPITTTDLPTVIRGTDLGGVYNPASRYRSDDGGSFDGRSYETPVYWEYWNQIAPPGTPTADDTYSNGAGPRYTMVHKQYLLMVGNGGEVTCFRHSGTVSGYSAPSPTALTLTGPTNGRAALASDVFTVQVSPRDSMLSGSVTVTLSDGGAGGTFRDVYDLTTITTLTLDANNHGASFRYTPQSGDAGTTITITITNNGGLTNP